MKRLYHAIEDAVFICVIVVAFVIIAPLACVIGYINSRRRM